MNTAYTRTWLRHEVLGYAFPHASHLLVMSWPLCRPYEWVTPGFQQEKAWSLGKPHHFHMRLLRRLSCPPACFQASAANSKEAWLHCCPLSCVTAPSRHWQLRHWMHDSARALLEERGSLGEMVNEDIRPTGMWKIVPKCNSHSCLERHIFSRKLNKTDKLLRLGIALKCTFKSLDFSKPGSENFLGCVPESWATHIL